MSTRYTITIVRLALFLMLCAGLAAISCPLLAYDEPDPTGPEIISVYPLAVQRGTSVSVAIRGQFLDAAYAVVFEEKGLTARVDRVEDIEQAVVDPETVADQSQAKDSKLRVVAQVDIDPDIAPGDHWLRVVTPRGVTNRMELRVVVDSIAREVETPHEIAERAQAIDYPVVVSGSITTAGEADVYVIDIDQPGLFFLEVRPSRGALAKKFRPSIEVLAYRETFFDPQRLTRVAFTDRAEGSEKVVMDRDPREQELILVPLEWDVTEAGRYFVRIACLNGWGAPEYVYQLRIVPAADRAEAGEPEEVRRPWQERSFTRKLSPNRLRELWSRGVWQPSPAADAATDTTAADEAEPTPIESAVISPDATIAVTPEEEPNGEQAQSRAVPIPGIAEGVIGEAGDVDVFKFQVTTGQKLAFEVETPEATRPDFSPVFEVVDAGGAEQLTSLQRGSGGHDRLVSLSAKVIRTFEKSGEYYLRVKDATLRKGGSDFVYRLLIRPQIPHVGDTVLETRTRGPEDGRTDPLRVNVVAGGAAKFTVMVNHEEGFYIPSNQIAIALEGLPEGVEVLPASSRYKGPVLGGPTQIADPEKHQPKTERISVVLHARKGAPLSKLPAFVDVSCRAVVSGVPAHELAVVRLPVMVLKPNTETP